MSEEMAGGAVDFVKKHPVPFAAGGLLVVVLLLRGGGNGVAQINSTNVSGAIQSQQIASQTSVALAGINADASKTIAGYTAQQNIATIQANAAVNASSFHDTLGAIMGIMNIGANQQAANNAFTLGMSQTAASQKVALANTAAQVAAVNDATQLGQLKANNDTLAINTAAALQGQALTVASSNLPLVLQSRFNLADLSAKNQQALANIQAQRDENLMDQQTSAFVNTNYANNAQTWFSNMSHDSSTTVQSLFNNWGSMFGGL